MNWITSGSILFFGIVLFLVKEEYKRTDVDIEAIAYRLINE